MERAVLHWMKVDPLLNPLSWVWRMAEPRGALRAGLRHHGLVAACLYYFGPYRPQRWRFVWPGALLATVLWLLATSGFGWYVRNMAHYNVMYGSVGAGIALLVWMYLMAVIALIGCEFNAEYERASQLGARPRSPAHPLQSQE